MSLSLNINHAGTFWPPASPIDETTCKLTRSNKTTKWLGSSMVKEVKARSSYPVLRVVGSAPGELLVPRRYAQSTSGRMVSQRTLPQDSRSTAMASDSAHVRKPYATLRKCPGVVPQDSANLSRASGKSVLRNSLSSIPDYHHTVTNLSTPNGEFTKRCRSMDNPRMASNPSAEIRRINLKALIERDFENNQSALARLCGKKPAYINDLVAEGSEKSFGEKAARGIEQSVGLLQFELDRPNSTLRMDPARQPPTRQQLKDLIGKLTPAEEAEVVQFGRAIMERRKKKQRRSA